MSTQTNKPDLLTIITINSETQAKLSGDVITKLSKVLHIDPEQLREENQTLLENINKSIEAIRHDKVLHSKSFQRTRKLGSLNSQFFQLQHQLIQKHDNEILKPVYQAMQNTPIAKLHPTQQALLATQLIDLSIKNSFSYQNQSAQFQLFAHTNQQIQEEDIRQGIQQTMNNLNRSIINTENVTESNQADDDDKQLTIDEEYVAEIEANTPTPTPDKKLIRRHECELAMMAIVLAIELKRHHGGIFEKKVKQYIEKVEHDVHSESMSQLMHELETNLHQVHHEEEELFDTFKKKYKQFADNKPWSTHHEKLDEELRSLNSAFKKFEPEKPYNKKRNKDREG